MLRVSFGALILSLLFSTHADQITISGVVQNKIGSPLSGASVSLKNQTVTTASDGSFSLSVASTNASHSSIQRSNTEPFIRKGMVFFGIVGEPQRVHIRSLDLQGRNSATILDQKYSSGSYSFPLTSKAAGVDIVSISIGNSTMVYKRINLTRRNGIPAEHINYQPICFSGLNKSLSITDTLIIKKSGYTTSQTPITDYNTVTHTIILTRDPASSNISIAGMTVSEGLSKRKAGSIAKKATTVLAVPIVGAKVSMDAMFNALRFPVNPDGSFNLDLPKQVEVFWSNSKDAEWVLLLLDTNQVTREEQFMGFVSMNGGSQSSMLSMPVSEGVEDVGLDTLRQTGDEMQSSASIDDNATAFDLSIDQLREMAKMDNAVKTVKNAFFNFYPEKKIYYAAPPTFAIDTYGDSLVYNRFADPSEFLDPARLTMAVQLNTNDTATFNNDSLSAGVQSIDLYVPAPSYTVDVVAYNKLDTTAWLKGYWPEYISSDSARNRINNTGVSYYQGHPGHLSDSWQIDIAFWVGGLRSDFKAGPFIYKKNRTSIVASYDWSVALPFDNNGKPIIYIPTIEVSTTEAHQIDSITVKWFTYDPQQSTYIEVTDLTMLSRMISGLDINPWDNGPPRGVHFSDLTKPCVIRCATQYPAETIYASHTHTDTDIGKTFIGGITVQYQQLGVNMALNWWFK